MKNIDKELSKILSIDKHNATGQTSYERLSRYV